MTKLTRRQFLTRAAAGTGAAALACCGLTTLAAQPPALSLTDLQSSGESPMNQKVLVAYATRSGSTMEVAQTVAAELTQRGYSVDIRPVKEISSVSGYGAVVLGSAVRFSSCLPELVKFVEQNAAALRQIPTAVFALHLLNQGSDEASTQLRNAYLDSVRKHIQPQSVALFTGVGDPKKMSFLEGLIVKMVKSPEGDFRDWNAIRGWAHSILQ